jgi:hypothetical protein
MNKNDDDLAKVILNTVREHALGPDYRNVATAYPLSAYGSTAGEDDFWDTHLHKTTKRWVGRPVITVRNEGSWQLSVYVDKLGRASIVVPKGTKVLEL